MLIYLGLMSGYLSLSCGHPTLKAVDVIGVSADVAVRRNDVRSVFSDVIVGRIYSSIRITSSGLECAYLTVMRCILRDERVIAFKAHATVRLDEDLSVGVRTLHNP